MILAVSAETSACVYINQGYMMTLQLGTSIVQGPASWQGLASWDVQQTRLHTSVHIVLCPHVRIVTSIHIEMNG